MRLFLLIFLFNSFFTHAQDEIYRNYTVEDGLPSSEVYYSFQDSKGYMWFATDAGVSRFNGYEFENFTTKNGLTDNTVFKITEDSRGRIWFAPFNGRICYYANDTIIEPPFIKKNSLGSLNYLESFYVDSLDNVWVGSLYSGILCISKEGKRQQMISLPKDQALRTKVIKVENKMIVGSLLSAKGKQALYSSNLTSIFFFKETLIRELYGATVDLYKISAENNFVSYLRGSNLCVIDKNGHKTKRYIPLLDDNKGIYLNSKGSVLYLGVENKGVYRYIYKEGKLILLDEKLQETSISSVFIDNTKGVWYTTLSNGVYYLPLKAISKNLFSSQQVYNMAVDKQNKKLYVSLRNGDLFEVTDSIQKIEKLKNNLFSIHFSNEEGALYWGSVEDSVLVKYKDGRHYKPSLLKDQTSFKSMLVKEGIIYYVNNTGLCVISDTSFFSSYRSSGITLWSTSLAFHNGYLWIGTNKGLRVFNGSKIKTPILPKNYLNLSITSMLALNDSILVTGSKEKGLMFLEKGRLKAVIDYEKGLISNTVKCVHVDQKGVLWCGTNKGLTRITRRKDEFVCYSITNKNGLVSEEIRSITSIGDSLFVGTAKGALVILSSELESNKIAPRLFFKKFSANSIEKSRKELKLLEYNENNISIEYLGINYKSQGEVNYKYRLIGEGTDTNWLSTYSRSVQYTLLPPSGYIFEIKAKNEDGVWNKPLEVPFTIFPPYWKTWWFISFIVVSFTLLLFWTVYSFFKRRENKIRVEKKLVELELKALRSQMNPHFIFNILNSIQHFMLQNNFKETNHYLTQFAKLIRTVLNLSEKNIITIGEEVEMLKLYMNLEKMRFENGFDYEIILGEDVDEDYDEIPSMLIQPYIENAIWHGLMNKNSKGKIVIKIDIIDGYLFCAVSDNGIGRDKAKEVKLNRKMKHKSVGMRITKDRLDLLNSETDVNVEIIDKVDEFNNPLGTKVNIKVRYVN